MIFCGKRNTSASLEVWVCITSSLKHTLLATNVWTDKLQFNHFMHQGTWIFEDALGMKMQAKSPTQNQHWNIVSFGGDGGGGLGGHFREKTDSGRRGLAGRRTLEKRNKPVLSVSLNVLSGSLRSGCSFDPATKVTAVQSSEATSPTMHFYFSSSSVNSSVRVNNPSWHCAFGGKISCDFCFNKLEACQHSRGRVWGRGS